MFCVMIGCWSNMRSVSPKAWPGSRMQMFFQLPFFFPPLVISLFHLAKSSWWFTEPDDSLPGSSAKADGLQGQLWSSIAINFFPPELLSLPNWSPPRFLSSSLPCTNRRLKKSYFPRFLTLLPTFSCLLHLPYFRPRSVSSRLLSTSPFTFSSGIKHIPPPLSSPVPPSLPILLYACVSTDLDGRRRHRPALLSHHCSSSTKRCGSQKTTHTQLCFSTGKKDTYKSFLNFVSSTHPPSFLLRLWINSGRWLPCNQSPRLVCGGICSD